MVDERPEEAKDDEEEGEELLEDGEFGEDLLVVLPDGESFEDGSFFAEAEASVEGVPEGAVDFDAVADPGGGAVSAGPVPLTILDVSPDGFAMVEGKTWDYLSQGYVYFIVNASQVTEVADEDLRAMAGLDGEVRGRGGQIVFSDLSESITAQVQSLGLYESISITGTEQEATGWLTDIVAQSTGGEVQIARVPIGGESTPSGEPLAAMPSPEEMPTVGDGASGDSATIEATSAQTEVPPEEPPAEESADAGPLFEEPEEVPFAEAAAEAVAVGDDEIPEAEVAVPAPEGESGFLEEEAAVEEEIVELTEDAVVEEGLQAFQPTPEMVTQEMGPAIGSEPESIAAEETSAASRIPDRPYVIVDGPPPGSGGGTKLLVVLIILAVLGGGGYAAYTFGYLEPVEKYIASLTGGGGDEEGGGVTDAGTLPSTDNGEIPVVPDPGTENGGTSASGGGAATDDPTTDSAGHVEALEYTLTDLLNRN